MNQDIKLSRQKLIALDRLVAAIRVSQNAAEAMDEAFAALLGINRTDQRCLDIVQRLGQITAGELASHSGLTTGAVTNVIDRLERAGYFRRVRDPSDRRKVLVELTETAIDLSNIVYSQIGVISGDSMSRMAIADMEMVARFLTSGARMNELLSDLLRGEVEVQAHDPDERMKAARNFAARVAAERDAMIGELRQVWNGPVPEVPSGKYFPENLMAPEDGDDV